MQRVVFAVLALSLFVLGAFGSSHSESPNTADSPTADWTDLYAFRSYEDGREDYFTILANLYPLQAPFGGPNYFTISDQYFYEIYMDTDADCVEDVGFRFMFGARMGGDTADVVVEPSDLDCASSATTSQNIPAGVKIAVDSQQVAIPLKYFKPITKGDNSGLNWFEYYSIESFQGDKDSGTTTQVKNAKNGDTEFTKPFDYAGTKTFPDYEDYANQYIYDIDFSGGQCKDGRVFVGQRADPFYITLGKIFDLLHFVPVPTFSGAIKENPLNNDLRRSNVHVVALELPIDCFNSVDGVIGIWLATRKLVHEGSNHVPGAQVNRLGSPLVNEVVIGLRDKAKFSHDYPVNDAANFAPYVTNPTFPAIVSSIFLGAVNDALNADLTTIAPTNFPRGDLIAAFLTGLDGFNNNSPSVPCEMLRLNLTFAAKPASEQDNMGLLNLDAAGFPNGRRPGDDVLDIVLRVAMGRLCHMNLGLCERDQAIVGDVDFTDGSPVNARDFQEVFPYLNVPYPGGYSGKPKTGCDSLNSDTETV